VTFLIVHDIGRPEPVQRTPPDAETEATAQPIEVSPADLTALASSTTQPVYWVGTRPNVTFELSQAGNNLPIRYLQQRAELEDPSPQPWRPHGDGKEEHRQRDPCDDPSRPERRDEQKAGREGAGDAPQRRRGLDPPNDTTSLFDRAEAEPGQDRRRGSEEHRGTRKSTAVTQSTWTIAGAPLGKRIESTMWTSPRIASEPSEPAR
jgi:hypothetical protein